MSPENDPTMKIERDIDAALKLLSTSQPPLAMRSRIHRHLETAEMATGQARRSRWLWIPATCATIAVILFAIYFQTHWVRGKRSPETETAKMVVDSLSPKFGGSRPEFSHEQQMSSSEIHHRREHPQHHQAVNLLSYPLTRQEKLLLRFVQTAKPKDLRDLNLEYQARVEAQQEAEFEANMKIGAATTHNE